MSDINASDDLLLKYCEALDQIDLLVRLIK